MLNAFRIVVSGLVQGVGFRPFVYRVATMCRVSGYVRNLGGSEVEIVVEGDEESLKCFFTEFSRNLPPPARIDEIRIWRIEPRGRTGFVIEKSSRSSVSRSAIPPDIAVCSYCMAEVLDPRDRRYRYPFNSCAWCGPRFSMMYTVPYDRENTSMRAFPLCEECLKEYTDPNNVRRFHAQGISCPRDGPKLTLYTIDGEIVDCRDPVSEVAKLIDEGFIVAIKGLGGFHVAALASDDDVVAKLRHRKRRPSKPFAVMALDLSVVERLVYLEPPYVRKVLESPQRPIVLLPKREGSPVSKLVSPGMAFEGVFLPYTPLHYLILAETRDRFAIMTSGNLHGEPMCRDEECVFRKLRNVVDYVLVHNREIVHRVDDSVVRDSDGELTIVRCGRGYAPTWIRIPIELQSDVVAMGADLCNAPGVGFENRAVLTPYIGDLDSFDAVSDMVRELEFLIDAYRIDTSRTIVVVDKHPNYVSRARGVELAHRWRSRIVEVQHHYAHVLATACDRGIVPEEPVIGIAIDGAGYGDDGAIWGCEVLLLQGSSYRRIGRAEYLPLTSDRDVVYPQRFLVATMTMLRGSSKALELARWLDERYGLPIPFRELELVAKLVEVGRYVPTSSLGRVLDTISILLGIAKYRSYEGEPAILLESAAYRGTFNEDAIPRLRIVERDSVLVIDTPSLIEYVVNALEMGIDVATIARTALERIGEALGEIVVRYARGRNVYPRIPIGGGAAVNTFILRGIKRILSQYELKLVLPRNVPPNDGGIALGQIYAVALMQRYG